MRSIFKKPIAVFFSVLMLFTMSGVGLVIPAFATDETALDAAVAEADALTPENYVDFSGVTVALEAAADRDGKTQIQIDDMEDAIRVAMAKLELASKYTPVSVQSDSSWWAANVAATIASISVGSAFDGKSLENSVWRQYQHDSINYMGTNQSVDDDVHADYYFDRAFVDNLSSLGSFITLSVQTTGKAHVHYLMLDKVYDNPTLQEECGLTTGTNKVTATSANGAILEYTLTNGGQLLFYTNSADLQLTYTSAVNGVLPDAGDSVSFRVIGHPGTMNSQGSFTVWVSPYITINLHSYDSADLRTALAIEVSSKSCYTAASYAAYRTALDAASVILNKGNPTQQEIDDAADTLNDAINGLQTTITIDGNNGTVSPETVTVTVGSGTTAAFPGDNVITATRPGYSFDGWDKDTVTFNDTVTAQWTARDDTAYTVNHYYMDTAGSYNVTPVTEGKTGTTDTSVAFADLLAVPDHFTFDAQQTGADSANIDGDGDTVIDLYYSRDQYTVTFVNGATNETLDTQEVYYEAAATAPLDIPSYVKDDANAVQHKKATGAWDTDFSSVSSDLTVTAQYADEDHNSNYTNNENGTHTVVCADCGFSGPVNCSDFNETPHAATCTKGAYVTYTCKQCGYSYDGEETAPANGHALSYADNENGTHTATCANCDFTETVACSEFDETPHAAICTKGAYVTYTCKQCGYSYDGEETVPANGHALSYADNENGTHTATCANCDFTETVACSEFNETAHEATCTKGAYVTYTCKQCGYSYDGEETAPANGHALSYADNNNGTHTASCANCDFTETVACSEFDETPHAATCTKGAYVTYTCKQCGYGYDGEETAPANSHALSYADNDNGTHTATCANCDFTETVACSEFNETAHEATCTKGAYVTYTCKQCGYSYDGEETAPANGHALSYADNGNGTHTATCANCDFTETVACSEFDETLHAATCTKGAYVTYTCKQCGYSYDGEAGAPIAHNYTVYVDTVAATCHKKGYDVYKCATCTATDKLNYTEGFDANNHSGDTEIRDKVTATCMVEGYSGDTWCLGCNTKIQDGVNTGYGAHQLEHTNSVKATCKDTGFVEYWSCNSCGKYFLTEDAATPLTEAELADQGVLPKSTEHTWGEWTVVTPATEDMDGEAMHVCTVCGAEETVPLSSIGEEITKTIKFINIAKMHYVIELDDGETYTIYNSSTVQWISNQPIRFKVVTYAGFAFDDIIVRANGVEITPDANGNYSIPQTEETVIVTVEGAVKDDASPTGKLSFWELLIRFFKKIVAFFSSAFGKESIC